MHAGADEKTVNVVCLAIYIAGIQLSQAGIQLSQAFNSHSHCQHETSESSYMLNR